MADQQVRKTLINLYRIVEAGEKGFATAASHMPNPALKILMMMYAQQRANFKEEILVELRRQGEAFSPGPSIPGMVHRGRVNIFAAMSIDREGQERTVLKEAGVGESAAMRAYASAVSEDLPPPVREMVERQFAEVRKVVETIKQLRGVGPRKMVVHIYQNDNDASIAVQNLQKAGFPLNSIERMSLKKAELYEGRGATVPETILSGAVGGALWGGLMGVFAGFGVVQTNLINTGIASVWLTWFLVALGFLLMGAFISSVLALFIGASISGADNYQVEQIRQDRQVLLRVVTDPTRAGEARNIMDEAVRSSSPAMINASV